MDAILPPTAPSPHDRGRRGCDPGTASQDRQGKFLYLSHIMSPTSTYTVHSILSPSRQLPPLKASSRSSLPQHALGHERLATSSLSRRTSTLPAYNRRSHSRARCSLRQRLSTQFARIRRSWYPTGWEVVLVLSELARGGLDSI